MGARFFTNFVFFFTLTVLLAPPRHPSLPRQRRHQRQVRRAAQKKVLLLPHPLLLRVAEEVELL